MKRLEMKKLDPLDILMLASDALRAQIRQDEEFAKLASNTTSPYYDEQYYFEKKRNLVEELEELDMLISELGGRYGYAYDVRLVYMGK